MRLLIFIFFLSAFFNACKKTNTPTTNPTLTVLNENTVIVSNDAMKNDLIEVDSTKLVFNANGAGLDKIKVGSILVSDITKVAPVGFLRKITSITISNGNEICTTDQATITDAITNGDIKFTKTFTDNDIIGQDTSGVDISALERSAKTQNLSFIFPYKKIMYDADGNNQTTNDQIYFQGEIDLEPTFDFELQIKDGKVQKLLIELTLKNTNKINFESKTTLASLSKEFVLTTFYLEPFTIPGPFGFPIPIAKQWIAIVIGVDGNISARITSGAQNINTLNSGVDYENGTWNTINTLQNSFTLLPLTFEGAATIEPWLMARYEIRPYGLPQSRIYLGARGSLIGEATLTSGGLNIVTKWGVKLSAKAQVQIFDRSLLNYEKIFYENEFPISQSTAFAYPILTTNTISSLTQSTANCGGNITSDGGAPITARGVCWSTSSSPTTANSKTTDSTGTGSFTSSLTGLAPNTTYYVRAYATNSSGTAYGNEVAFKTATSGVTIPIVTTTAITGITQTTAQSGGAVTSDGNATVTSRGVCWNTSSNPTIANNKTIDGTGAGSFTSSLTGLLDNTIYYVRAYATNSSGTAYGNDVSFKTSLTGGSDSTVTDIDGNIYHTVKIGTQTWMVENLKTTHYRNGDELAYISNGVTFVFSDTGAYTLLTSNLYGNLYNWYAATDSRNICPAGWHLPSDAEWTTLTNFLGGESIAGDKMKATSSWNAPATAATNESGFTAFPAGYLDGNNLGNLTGYGFKCYWWSSTIDYAIDVPWVRSLANNNAGVQRVDAVKYNGFSIRCVKD